MQKKEILKPGSNGKFLLKMPLFNLISGPGYNDRISHIFLIKMKNIRFFEALTFVYEILYDLISFYLLLIFLIFISLSILIMK